jgi:uncharacterized RDD family membrane protein YckC
MDDKMLRTPDPDSQPQFYDGVAVKRLLAWMFDVVAITIFCLILLPFTAFTGVFFFPMMFVVVSFAYRVITLTNGSATWGMWLMAIELRTREDERFDFLTALLHTSAYAVSVAMAPAQLVSVLLMATSARAQGLTDMLIGTAALNRRVLR